jgi:hypothetical protein
VGSTAVGAGASAVGAGADVQAPSSMLKTIMTETILYIFLFIIFALQID